MGGKCLSGRGGGWRSDCVFLAMRLVYKSCDLSLWMGCILWCFSEMVLLVFLANIRSVLLKICRYQCFSNYELKDQEF